jgi:hypothetical protein
MIIALFIVAQKVETTHVSINQQMNKQNMVCIPVGCHLALIQKEIWTHATR